MNYRKQPLQKDKVMVLSVFKIFLSLGFIAMLSSNLVAQLPTGFVKKNLTNNNINEAVTMAHAPDGRIFLAERSGNVKVYKTDGTVATVHTVATTTATEQGLLGMTLHPDFPTNGKCYIYYTNAAGTYHYLDLIIINVSNVVTSSTRLITFDPILAGFHNGGAMAFKGGFLYLCVGESNTSSTAQNLDTYMGKVLRLTEDGVPVPDNPYFNTPGANTQKKSIWAIGMRNPWTMSVDPMTGKIYVVNVGGNYEEVDDVTNPDAAKNYNYGWGAAGLSGPDQPNTTIHAAFSYGHAGWGCAITTGAAFNPAISNYPASYKGRFFFSDWCSGWLRSFDMSNPAGGYQEFSATGFNGILGLSVGIDGSLYYIQYNTNGNLYKLEYTLATTPIIVNHPASQTVFVNDAVTFTASASGAATLNYQWRKDGIDILNANSNTYIINSVVAGNAGNYTCYVSNTHGNATTNAATLTVKPFNAIPVAKIITPLPSATWSVADVINYSGSATDAEDGTLPASAYQWEVRLFHKDCPTCEHWHPGPSATQGASSGSFIADNGGESSSNIWVRLILSVTDANGRVGKDSVDLQPNKVIVTVTSSKPGLQVVLGNTEVTPYNKTMVVNTATVLQAISPQTLGDSIYTFSSWSHGGDATQNLRAPAMATTYKAIYTRSYTGQAPYGGLPRSIPGKIEIEDYDTGGEGLAFHDASNGNAGNQYRTAAGENVDIEICNEGGFNIGYVVAGEWLEYSVNVIHTGIYSIELRVAAPGGGRTAHLEMDGVNISGTINIPVTGAYQNWQTVTINNVNLTAGNRVLRLALNSDNFNVNYVVFNLVTTTNTNSGSAFLQQLSTYPNPVTNYLNINTHFARSGQAKIAIINMDGKVVLSKIYQNASGDFEDRLDVYSLNSGMYMLQIVSEENVIYRKFTKE